MSELVTLTTTRLTLREFYESDGNALYELYSLPETSEYESWGPHQSIEDSKGLLAYWIEEQSVVPRTDYTLGVTLDSRMIGLCGIELGFGTVSGLTDIDEFLVGVATLRVFVDPLHIAVSWCAIDIVIALFHIFAMIAFWSGDAEEPLFQDRVAAIPQANREAESTFSVTDAKQTVFAPTVRAAPRLIVREVSPSGITTLTVIFANRSPLSL